MYCIKDNNIKEIKIVKSNEKNTLSWCKFNGTNDLKLVSKEQMFESISEAEQYLYKKKKLIRTRQDAPSKEYSKIKDIMYNIQQDFNVEVPLSSYPFTAKEAEKIYNNFKYCFYNI